MAKKSLILKSQRTPKYKERFLVKVGAKLLPLLTSDIAYFTSSEGMTELTTEQQQIYQQLKLPPPEKTAV